MITKDYSVSKWYSFRILRSIQEVDKDLKAHRNPQGRLSLKTIGTIVTMRKKRKRR
jgi:hypothetical protein